MYRAYKFRLYPNKEQKEIINKTFGSTRLLYNHYLDKKQELYQNEHKNISMNEIIKDIPNLYFEKPFLKEVDSIALRCSIFDLEDSYQRFFKEKKGYPKYKRKFDKNSYRTNCIRSTYKGNTYENIKLDLKNRTITLPKLKEMKIRGYRKLRQINGRIINATVSREKDGKYYVSVLYDEEVVVKPIKLTKIIGIDLGIKDLVITSDYKKYENEKIIEKFEKRIERYQRRLSKKIKGSKNYYKLKQKLARLYTKIKKEIVEENDIIVTETLSIKNMIQNHNLARSLSDATLGEFIRILEYKAKWKGKKFYKINPYYASSQICSKCGYKNETTKDLTVRKYECPRCENKLDRDYNASENIMFEGLKMYMKELMV